MVVKWYGGEVVPYQTVSLSRVDMVFV